MHTSTSLVVKQHPTGPGPRHLRSAVVRRAMHEHLRDLIDHAAGYLPSEITTDWEITLRSQGFHDVLTIAPEDPCLTITTRLRLEGGDVLRDLRKLTVPHYIALPFIRAELPHATASTLLTNGRMNREVRTWDPNQPGKDGHIARTWSTYSQADLALTLHTHDRFVDDGTVVPCGLEGVTRFESSISI